MSVDIVHWSTQLQAHLHIAHHIPGRLRLQFNNKFMALLSKSKLSAIDRYCRESGPLYCYELNTNTGSILIQYDPQVISPKTIDLLFDNNTELAHKSLSALLSLAQHYID